MNTCPIYILAASLGTSHTQSFEVGILFALLTDSKSSQSSQLRVKYFLGMK